MLDHPHAALAWRLWMATAKGDAEALRSVFDPDVVWLSFNAGDLSGEIHGVDDLLAWLARSGELVEEMRIDLIDIFASDRGAVIHYDLYAERSGRTVSTDIVLVATIEGGRITHARTIPADAEANRRFWSSI
jgi:ketosteroid isomerase-like protein